MKGSVFFDTNIFVYADDHATPKKSDQAVQLIYEYQRSGKAVISLQVMQEYFSAVTRKLGVDPHVAQAKVELMARLRIVRFVESDIVAAIELHRLSKVSFWDAMIIHAARTAKVDFLFSEDLAHGSKIAGVQIVNPFV